MTLSLQASKPREMRNHIGNEKAAQSFFVTVGSLRIRFLNAIRLIYLIWTNALVSLTGELVVAGVRANNGRENQ